MKRFVRSLMVCFLSLSLCAHSCMGVAGAQQPQCPSISNQIENLSQQLESLQAEYNKLLSSLAPPTKKKSGGSGNIMIEKTAGGGGGQAPSVENATEAGKGTQAPSGDPRAWAVKGGREMPLPAGKPSVGNATEAGKGIHAPSGDPRAWAAKGGREMPLPPGKPSEGTFNRLEGLQTGMQELQDRINELQRAQSQCLGAGPQGPIMGAKPPLQVDWAEMARLERLRREAENFAKEIKRLQEWAARQKQAQGAGGQGVPIPNVNQALPGLFAEVVQLQGRLETLKQDGYSPDDCPELQQLIKEIEELQRRIRIYQIAEKLKTVRDNEKELKSNLTVPCEITLVPAEVTEPGQPVEVTVPAGPGQPIVEGGPPGQPTVTGSPSSQPSAPLAVPTPVPSAGVTPPPSASSVPISIADIDKGLVVPVGAAKGPGEETKGEKKVEEKKEGGETIEDSGAGEAMELMRRQGQIDGELFQNRQEQERIRKWCEEYEKAWEEMSKEQRKNYTEEKWKELEQKHKALMDSECRGKSSELKEKYNEIWKRQRELWEDEEKYREKERAKKRDKQTEIYLNDKDPRKRRDAIKVASVYWGEKALSRLIDMAMKDDDYNVRKEALEGIHYLGEKSVCAALKEFIKKMSSSKEDRRSREIALNAVYELVKMMLPPRETPLKEGGGLPRRGTQFLLPPCVRQAINALIDLISDKDIGYLVLLHLRFLGPDVRPPEPQEGERRLERTGAPDKDPVPKLRDMMRNSESESERLNAAETLIEIDPSYKNEARELFKKAYERSSSYDVLKNLLPLLDRKEALDLLKKLLKENKKWDIFSVTAVVDGLAKLGGDEAVRELERIARDSNENGQLRIEAAAALSRQGKAQEEESLKILKDIAEHNKDESIRNFAKMMLDILTIRKSVDEAIEDYFHGA